MNYKDGKLKVGETLKNNLSRWVLRELNLDLPEDFDVDYCLKLMDKMGLVKLIEPNLLEVLPFDKALNNLIAKTQLTNDDFKLVELN